MEDRKVIAVDFDGTLFTANWPGVGQPIWPVINKAKQERENGAAIILWTCRAGESLQNAVEACEKVGLVLDGVNETLPEWLDSWVDDPRKIGASEYWDDRAVNVENLLVDRVVVQKENSKMAKYKVLYSGFYIVEAETLEEAINSDKDLSEYEEYENIGVVRIEDGDLFEMG